MDVVRSGVGLISVGDVAAAAASEPKAIIYGFNVKPARGVQNMVRCHPLMIKSIT